MDIIIAGCGKVGTVLAKNLSNEGHDITVIDTQPEKLEYISNSLDVMCMAGNAASYEVLRSVNAQRADLLIAVTNMDELNLLICLTAKKIGVKNTIARVRNPIYSETVKLIKSELGLSMVINPEHEAAAEMFRPLIFKSADQIETFSKSRMEILTCTVHEEAPICDVKIKDLERVIGARVLVCAIKRDGQVFIPNGFSDIKAGDKISFLSGRDDAQKFFKKCGYEMGRVKNLTIIGGGKLGYYLGKNALENGIPVRIIDRSEECCEMLQDLLPSAEIIYGDGTNTSLIEEENVLGSSAVAVLTGIDETNILISMFISKNAPKCKVICKIKKSDFEDMVFNMDIGSIYNPKYITVDHILRYVRAMEASKESEVVSLSHIIDNKVEVLEFALTEQTPNTGKSLQELQFKDNLLLAAITRRGRTFAPGGSDTIEVGDNVIVVTTHSGIGSFTEVFA